jgi:hypothetical protein
LQEAVVQQIGTTNLNAAVRFWQTESNLGINCAVSGYITRYQRTFPQEGILPSPGYIKTNVLCNCPIAKGQVSSPFWCIETCYKQIGRRIAFDIVVIDITCQCKGFVEIIRNALLKYHK